MRLFHAKILLSNMYSLIGHITGFRKRYDYCVQCLSGQVIRIKKCLFLLIKKKITCIALAQNYTKVTVLFTFNFQDFLFTFSSVIMYKIMKEKTAYNIPSFKFVSYQIRGTALVKTLCNV